MSEHRVVKNAYNQYKVQRKVLCFFWRDIGEYDCGVFHRSVFNTKESAFLVKEHLDKKDERKQIKWSVIK